MPMMANGTPEQSVGIDEQLSVGLVMEKRSRVGKVFYRRKRPPCVDHRFPQRFAENQEF